MLLPLFVDGTRLIDPARPDWPWSRTDDR